MPRVEQKHLQLLYGRSVQEAGAAHLRDVVPAQVQHFQGQVSLQPIPLHTANLIVLTKTNKGWWLPACLFAKSYFPPYFFGILFPSCVALSENYKCSVPQSDISRSPFHQGIIHWMGASRNTQVCLGQVCPSSKPKLLSPKLEHRGEVSDMQRAAWHDQDQNSLMLLPLTMCPNEQSPQTFGTLSSPYETLCTSVYSSI